MGSIHDDDWKKEFEKWKSEKDKSKESPFYTSIRKGSFKHPVKVEEHHPSFVKFLIFLAFAIPVSILGYAFYINYLPFGYENTYSLTIDEVGIISPLSREIYITTPQGRKLLSLPSGVLGQVNLVLDSNIALKDATLNITLEGSGVYLGTPLDIDLNAIEWDYNWDFNQSVLQDFEGSATYDGVEQCTHFNAYNEETLSLPDSKDLFDNWEFWQSEKNVQFIVGRMNDGNGTFYSVNYPIDFNFFGKEHEALAVYSPDENGNGYIELWVDSNLGGRTLIGSDVIYEDYNS